MKTKKWLCVANGIEFPVSVNVNDEPKAKMVPTEAWEQEQFFKWVRANQLTHPVLQLVNGSMNGVPVTKKVAGEMKRQGLRRGVPDIDIPAARHGYHGLRIEMKRRVGGVVSEAQKDYHKRLSDEGYLVVVCLGWNEAVSVAKKYLGIE